MHESASWTELTVNVTRSEGVPCLPFTGLLGRTAAETEVTVATGLPAVGPEPPDVDVVTCPLVVVVVVVVEADVGAGLLPQPANAAATHNAATGTAHARDTGQS